MGKMSIRSTYALDPDTDQRIRRLARLWGVSQAEVIRRSVERAAAETAGDALTPADVIAYYASNVPARSAAQTRRLVESMRRSRADQVDLARAFIQGRIVAAEEADSELAAALFNAAGRQRNLKTDALIAAIAMRADAVLVTLSTPDLLPFTGHGLRLFEGDLAL